MNTRPGPWAFGLMVAAFVWTLGLVAAAFVAPVYRGATQSTSGVTTGTSATLVGENGAQVLLVAALPALLTGLAGVALHRKCTRGSRRGERLAWLAVWLLGGLAIVAAASIGLYVLPAALLLAAAAALTPAPGD